MVLVKSSSTGKNVENWVLIIGSAPKVQLGVVQCPGFFFFYLLYFDFDGYGSNLCLVI